ncbi:uncharacterized protein PHACADRAFT_176833 [Phanerochaete carnosa HHB-10118-sp]|uniref:Uncharacterized protein n=1 Tax=Phanerochaete carnosa (strain HHB-10118-sp) TaxID=650164 RepID=K5W1T2_PHACS|nr:uncharacterized protein PHACADRAFT_176833 [Phanerochaete carnosa HHB-10118-sp]EKM52824.1 hypothetical protein PHACADRAFT_176833 [Phanerochaete carnosa HHB-10118-sp]
MASYDERLLDSAPVVTREAKQEGYNVDLLDDSRRAGSSSPETRAPLASNHGHAEAALASKEQLAPYPAARPIPWWKTKKFIVFSVIFAVVAIAAIVGGAVGGSVHHHNKSNSTDTSGSQTSSSPTATGTTAANATSGNSNQNGGGNSTNNSGGNVGPNVGSGTSSLATTTGSNFNPAAVANLAQPTSDVGVVAGEIN